MIVFLLSALDQTIVSTAMPRIVAAQLQGLNLYAWVTTAYLLSSTVMVPIYGKLSDLYGRKIDPALRRRPSSPSARCCAACPGSSARCRCSAAAWCS